jgi:hypothetical protein
MTRISEYLAKQIHIRDMAIANPQKIVDAGMDPEYVISWLSERVAELGQREAEWNANNPPCPHCGKQ